MLLWLNFQRPGPNKGLLNCLHTHIGLGFLNQDMG